MPYPANVATVTVTGTWARSDGSSTPSTGNVTFVPNVRLADGTTGQLIEQVPLVAPLVNGAISAVVIATDDPDLAPSGWAYVVTENIDGQAPVTRILQFPAAQSPVNLATKEGLVPAPGLVGYVALSAVGAPFGVASLDINGDVPLSQLGNAPSGGGGGVPTTRHVDTTAPLGGGGDLSVDRTLTVSGAAAGARGVIQLAGDLAGTADAPTVPGLATKVDSTRHVDTAAPLTGGGDLSGDRTLAVSGATTGARGVVKLAGDLGGTADAPTVPALAAKADLVGGVVPTAQLPAIAVSDYLGAVGSQSAMLALTGQRGDWCARTDQSKNYILSGDDASQLSNWVGLVYPGAPVTSVNGQTGIVVLAASDVGAVPTSRQINSTDGTLTGTGDLSANRDLSVAADKTTQRIEVASAGSLIGTRKRVNFTTTGLTLSVTDNGGSNRVDVGITATPAAIGDRDAAVLGLVAVTIPYTVCNAAATALALANGTMVMQLWRPGAVPIANLGTWLTRAGVTNAGYSGLALYDASGNLIDKTVDMSTLFDDAPPTYIEAALQGGTYQAAADTSYYVAMVAQFSGTTPCVAGVAPTGGNVPAIKGNYPSLLRTGTTSFPSSFTPSSATKNNGSYFMAAS